MSRTAYLTDIFSRSFFIFVVLDLLLRQWFLALFLAIMINVIFELTVGRKFWQTWKNVSKKQHRNWRVVLRSLWQKAFSRERTKGLVFAGVIILFMSYFVKLQIYYVVVASFVFTMAAITRFAPPTKSVTMSHEPSQDTYGSSSNCSTPPTK